MVKQRFHTIKSILNERLCPRCGCVLDNSFHTIKSILNHKKNTKTPPQKQRFHTIKSILNIFAVQLKVHIK